MDYTVVHDMVYCSKSYQIPFESNSEKQLKQCLAIFSPFSVEENKEEHAEEVDQEEIGFEVNVSLNDTDDIDDVEVESQEKSVEVIKQETKPEKV